VYSKGLNTVSVAIFHTFSPVSELVAAWSAEADVLSDVAVVVCVASLEPQAVRPNNITVASNIEIVFFFIIILL
jgi:hypothetical protein